ncbi:GDSL esterase/lipase 7 [Vigna radiata var. radiata]|uniref:GDSL esterase/lipase 7 n=1 Tax=Vigna radiata var. radiata TaxID=3916 RepID=A0A3Q0EPX8_VIGRR|nr:GDSL esterase/lipase 7 [Vigna radiata var. radiata]
MEQVMMIFVSLVFFELVVSAICGNTLAPALYLFGDSSIDNGNNNLLPTLARANFFPYGIDFPRGSTGRFTDGKTIADFIAEYLGLPYPPPYISMGSSRSLTGINYASASCGILPETGANFGRCLNLRDQVNLFQNTVEKDLAEMINNSTQLCEHLSKSMYVFITGTNDYISKYLGTTYSGTDKIYQSISFADLLIATLSDQFKRIYNLGGRKIVISEIRPVGCIPRISRGNPCVEELNQMVTHYNERLPPLLKTLTSTLPGSTFLLIRSNSIEYDAIKNPSKYGLSDVSNTCCRSNWGNGSAGCVPLSTPCQNRSQYVFWDGFHLTETVHSIISSQCISDRSVCTPVTIEELVKM